MDIRDQNRFMWGLALLRTRVCQCIYEERAVNP